MADVEQKKKWLYRYRDAMFYARSLWRQAKEWQDLIYEPSSKVLDGMPHAPSIGNVEDKKIIKHLNLIDEAQEATDKAYAIRLEVISAIQMLEDIDHIKVLTLRYIEGNSWDEIRDEVHYSQSHVFRLHDEAIDLLNVGSK